MLEEYVHRIGRTGRVGNNGEAVSFFDMEVDTKIIKVRENIPLIALCHGEVSDEGKP